MLTEAYCNKAGKSNELTVINTKQKAYNAPLTSHGDGPPKSRSLSDVPVSCKRIVQLHRPGERKREREEKRFRDTSTLHKLYYTSLRTERRRALIFCFKYCDLIMWSPYVSWSSSTFFQNPNMSRRLICQSNVAKAYKEKVAVYPV